MGGVEDGEGPNRKRDGEGLSGENKPFAALIVSGCSSIMSKKMVVHHMAIERVTFLGSFH